MTKYFLVLISVFVIVSCNNNKKAITTTVVTKTDSSDIVYPADTTADEPGWTDSLTNEYIKYLKRTRNPMIWDENADTAYHMVWMFNQLENTDTASYYMMQLGFNMEYPDHEGDHFATIGWFYIDSLTHKTYSYDDAGDSMIYIDLNKKYAPGEFYPCGYLVNGSSDHKVYFCNAPDSSTRRKAFFNTRAGVYVEKIANGYGYVEFFNTKGKASNGWIDMNDLLPYPVSADK